MPAIPERGDASGLLKEITQAKARGRSSKLNPVDSAISIPKYAAPMTAEVGQKVDPNDRILSMVKQSPYSNIKSQSNIAGGLVSGGAAFHEKLTPRSHAIEQS